MLDAPLRGRDFEHESRACQRGATTRDEPTRAAGFTLDTGTSVGHRSGTRVNHLNSATTSAGSPTFRTDPLRPRGPFQSVSGVWPGLALVTHTRLAPGSIAYRTRPAPVTSSYHCSSAWPPTSREPRSPPEGDVGGVGVCGRSSRLTALSLITAVKTGARVLLCGGHSGEKGDSSVAERHAGMSQRAGRAEIEVEFTQDPDSHTWAYRIPSLHVTGVAESEAAAVELAQESIVYALESPEPGPGSTKKGYFSAKVSVPKHLVPG